MEGVRKKGTLPNIVDIFADFVDESHPMNSRNKLPLRLVRHRYLISRVLPNFSSPVGHLAKHLPSCILTLRDNEFKQLFRRFGESKNRPELSRQNVCPACLRLFVTAVCVLAEKTSDAGEFIYTV